MDGVLADTERDGHRPAFNQAFQEAGIDTEWNVERYGKLLHVGGGKERMTAHWNEVGWPSNVLRPMRQDKVKELHLRKTDIFMDMINQKKIPLRPGVLRVIDEAIAAGVKLAVCSTSNEKAVQNLVYTLMGAERAAKFKFFAGDMVKNKKPAPDVYLMAVDQMGLDKSRCVVVEDSGIGLKSAIAAGRKQGLDVFLPDWTSPETRYACCAQLQKLRIRTLSLLQSSKCLPAASCDNIGWANEIIGRQELQASFFKGFLG
eukprot:scaffold2934_cov176-Amphora_coffeaeformis.AAC.2